MPDHMAAAVDAARKAGEMLKAHFGATMDIERKPDRSLVTNLDKEAERIVVALLRGSFPSYGIIGEEGGATAGSGAKTWVIDPLDGTHNYIRGIPVYGVSIGLMQDKEFVAGVIYMPAEGDLYTAETGGGSWKNGKRIRVSRCSVLEECSLSYDSGFRTDAEKKTSCMNRFASRVFNLRMTGSSVRNLTYLAEGKVDMLVEFDEKIWDFAAGVALVREAGGTMTNHQGGPIDADRGCYCATNGLLHDVAMEIIRTRR